MTRTPPLQGEGSERLRLRLLDVVDQLRRAERHLAAGDATQASAAIGTALDTAQAAFEELLPQKRERAPAVVRADDPALEVVRAAQDESLTAAGCTVEERFMGTDGRVVTFVRRPNGATYGVVSTVIGGRVARDEQFDTWREALRAVGGAAARERSG